MDTINKTELKIIIGWCKEKGHSSDETLDLLMRIANGSEECTESENKGTEPEENNSELKPVPSYIIKNW